MIFVTVGTHTQNFNRLLKEVDRLVDRKKLKGKVVAQIGHSTYEPKNMEWFRITTPNKFKELCKKAKLIITHGGAGNIITALSSNKPVIIVPRLKRFGECVDDHQLQLAKKLAKEGKAIAVYDIADLEDSIKNARKFKKFKPRKTKLADTIKTFIEYGAIEKDQIFTMDVEEDIDSAVEFASLLAKHKMKGEFYICGYLVEKYPAKCRKIAKKHIVGGHGFRHENFSKLSCEKQLDLIVKTQKTFEKHGMNMFGWRFPGFCFKHDSLSILAERDIFDSSFREPRVKLWGRLFFLRVWLKNLLAERVLYFPRPFTGMLIEKPFSAVDIERDDFYRYTGRIVTHCYNYKNFKKRVENYLKETSNAVR